MENSFLKSKFASLTDNQTELSEALENLCANKNKLFLLKHNLSAFSKVVNFLNNDEKLLILKGNTGSGKSDILKLITNDFVDENILIFKSLLYGAINLDDILLFLHKEFSMFHAQKKIVLPKTDITIFSEKINVYIKHTQKPMLFVFDMFEMNFLSQKKQDEIIEFIKYLMQFDNTKILIASRSLSGNEFKIQEKIVMATLLPLTKEEYSEYFGLNKVKVTEKEVEQIFSETKGQFVFLDLALDLINIMGYKSTDLIEEFKKKNLYFSDFLIQKNLSLLSDKFKTLFYLLSTIRVGVSETFILDKKLISKDELQYLLDRNIVLKEFNVYYMKDYYKTPYFSSISSDIKIKLFRELSKFYESLLPKKPFERELFISRLTMRKEIEYCTDMLERLMLETQKPKRKTANADLNFNYLSYSTSISNDWATNTSLSGIEPVNIPNIPKQKSTKSARFDLSNDDINLLHLISDKDRLESKLTNIVKEEEKVNKEDVSVQPKVEQKEEIIEEDFEGLIQFAADFEKKFDYKTAIEMYLKALTHKDNPLFEAKEPILISKLAQCYRKIQETEKAVENFQKAYDIYSKIDKDRALYMLLYIAQSYNEVYRFNEAQDVYRRILNISKNVPDEVLFRVNLDLSEIEDSNMNTQKAIQYAHIALEIAEKLNDKRLLTESYFKYALYNDDLNNYSIALKYYLQCIKTSQNIEENSFLSPAYSNLALLSLESKDTSTAIMYHQKAIEVDRLLDNKEGLYFSYIKLAEIYKKTDLALTFDYLYKALKTIRRINDKTAIINVYTELGDCYMQNKDSKKALKAYFYAENLITKTAKFEELFTVESKIKILKHQLGEETFNAITKKLRRK